LGSIFLSGKGRRKVRCSLDNEGDEKGVRNRGGKRKKLKTAPKGG